MDTLNIANPTICPYWFMLQNAESSTPAQNKFYFSFKVFAIDTYSSSQDPAKMKAKLGKLKSPVK